MSEVLALEHLAIQTGGPALSLVVSKGQTLAVTGPAGSGKTHFLNILSGEEHPAEGALNITGRVVVAATGLNQRHKVQRLARPSGLGTAVSQVATEALMATRLWDLRNVAVSELTPGQRAAAELLEALVTPCELLVIDGHLDRLDPWALHSVLDYLHRLRSSGTAVVAATNRPDLISLFDALVVLKDKQVRFAGSVRDLLRNGPAHHVTVSTENQPATRALVGPFEVQVTQTEDGMCFRANEGQELAARLLRDGYGDVRFVVVRPPTVEDALMSL